VSPFPEGAVGPVRTCVGCRVRASQSELVRVAWDGAALVVSRTAPGRGAWLHPQKTCWQTAAKKGAVSRGLRAPVPATVVLELADEVCGA